MQFKGINMQLNYVHTQLGIINCKFLIKPEL